jgi:AcrR family transcriptional regulator
MTAKQPSRSRAGRKKKLVSREIIEDCAIKLFQAKGVDKTSISEIVLASGIAKGTFYLYFKNKNELVDAVINRYVQEFLDQVILPNIDINKKLLNLSTAVMTYFKTNRMFLVELRRNVLSDNLFPSTQATITAFAQLVIANLNQYESYPITNWEAYSKVIMGMVLDVCYKAIIVDELGGEAEIMLSDFLKRFFSCD